MFKRNKMIDFFKGELISSGFMLNGIALFGSYLKEGQMKNDIDLIVISDSFKKKSLLQRAKMIADAELKTMRRFDLPMDVLCFTSREYKNFNENNFIENRIVA